MKLTISIVIYNTPQQIWQNCLNTLRTAINTLQKEQGIKTAVYIVDNSPNSSYQSTINDDYHYIANPSNKGYGHGNNLALQEIDSDYHLVMNPDVYLAKNTLCQAINFIQAHQDVGLLAPFITTPDGEWQNAFKQHPTLWDHFLRQFAPGWLKRRNQARMQRFAGVNIDPEQSHFDIPSVMGSFMFFRSSFLKLIHGFDNRFFLYFEDDDISRRLAQHARTAYTPTVKIIHEHAHQTQRSWKHKFYFAASLLRYWRKWGGLW
tara:strand:- start:190807 stop:191592 length:786 start_codon:yes stop_codon:yes gene_type:complete